MALIQSACWRRTRVTAVVSVVLLLSALAWPAIALGQADCSSFRINPSSKVDGVWILRDAQVRVTARGRSAREVKLYYLGYTRKLGETSGGSTLINVDSFARWGVGRYTVKWGRDCSAEIEVARNGIGVPVIHSWAGAAASTALVLGLAGFALMLAWRVRISSPDARWVVKLLGRSKLERGEDGRLHARLSYTISQTLFGTLWGLILGGASFAFLQQAAVTPPTIEVALEVSLPITVLGALAGLRRGRPRTKQFRGAATPAAPI